MSTAEKSFSSARIVKGFQAAFTYFQRYFSLLHNQASVILSAPPIPHRLQYFLFISFLFRLQKWWLNARRLSTYMYLQSCLLVNYLRLLSVGWLLYFSSSYYFFFKFGSSAFCQFDGKMHSRSNVRKSLSPAALLLSPHIDENLTTGPTKTTRAKHISSLFLWPHRLAAWPAPNMWQTRRNKNKI